MYVKKAYLLAVVIRQLLERGPLASHHHYAHESIACCRGRLPPSHPPSSLRPSSQYPPIVDCAGFPSHPSHTTSFYAHSYQPNPPPGLGLHEQTNKTGSSIAVARVGDEAYQSSTNHLVACMWEMLHDACSGPPRGCMEGWTSGPRTPLVNGQMRAMV